jgi:hypothetical protein
LPGKPHEIENSRVDRQFYRKFDDRRRPPVDERVYTGAMRRPRCWLPSYRPRDGQPYVPWTVRTLLPIDRPFVHPDHFWTEWATTDE